MSLRSRLFGGSTETDRETWEKITTGELAELSVACDELSEQAHEIARQEAADIESVLEAGELERIGDEVEGRLR